NIDQQGGAVAIATPMDKELAELSQKLNTTYVGYGRLAQHKAANQAIQDANAYKQNIQAAASRDVSMGGALYSNAEWAMVDRCKEDPKSDITKILENELCDTLKKMKPAERVTYVKEQAAKRLDVQKQIEKLSAKRAEFIAVESKKNAGKADKALDEAIRGAVREQAAPKGIKIPE